MTQAQPTQLDAAHFDAKVRQWDDNRVFRERGRKIADAIRKAVPLHRQMRTLAPLMRIRISGSQPNSQ